MKTLYECEVCHQLYDRPEAASECESAPVLPAPPPGLLLTRLYDREPSFTALCTGQVKSDRHYHQHGTFWFRGNERGDDDELPRNDIVTGNVDLAAYYQDTDTGCPSFQRALAKCIAMGYPPSIIAGGKLTPYTPPALT